MQKISGPASPSVAPRADTGAQTPQQPAAPALSSPPRLGRKRSLPDAAAALRTAPPPLPMALGPARGTPSAKPSHPDAEADAEVAFYNRHLDDQGTQSFTSGQPISRKRK